MKVHDFRDLDVKGPVDSIRLHGGPRIPDNTRSLDPRAVHGDHGFRFLIQPLLLPRTMDQDNNPLTRRRGQGKKG